MSAAIRVGVVGAGAMGEAHLAAYARLPDVVVVGIATRSRSRGEALAARFGMEAAAVVPDVDTLLDAARPDGLSICTRDDEHVASTVAALDQGVGVLLEKPIAADVAGAETIAAAVQRTGGLLVPGHILRFCLPYQRLQAEVAAGRIGSVVGVAARRDRTRFVHEHYAHVHPAFLTCVHDIDLTLWVTGARATRVRSLDHRSPGDAQPDIVWAQAELTTGAVATFATATLHPAGVPVPTSDRFEIYGSAGVATVDLTNPALVVHGASSQAPDWLFGLEDGSGAMLAEVAHFVACLRAGTPSAVIGVDEALHGIRIADAIVRSGTADGAWVDIPD